MSAADRAAFMRMMGITDDDLLDPNENTNTSTTTTPAENTQHKSISLHATLSSASSSAGLSSAAGTHTTSTVHLSPSSSATLTRTTSLSLPQASLPQPSLSCTHQSIPTINMTNTLSETHFSPNEEEPTPASTQTLLLSSPELLQTTGLHYTPHTTTTTTTTNTTQYTTTGISGIKAGHSAEELKAAGNAAFTRGAFVEAITHYSHAIEALRDMQRNSLQGDTDNGGVFVELLAALYGNRSASYLQAARALDSIEVAYEHALMDAETAVQLRPSWFKGYARQGDVYFKMLHYSKAADAYAMALRLEPSNANVERAYYESRTRASAASREEIARRRARRSRQRMSSTSRPRLTSAASMPNTTNESSMHGVPPITRTLVLQAPTANNDNTSSSMECMSVQGQQETKTQHVPSAQQTPALAETALNTTTTTTTTTTTLASETSSTSKSETDHNTPAKAMWRELKAELATLSQEPTGDDYRRQQLERFRRQQRQQQSRSLSQNTTTTTTTIREEANVSCNAGQTSIDVSPHTTNTSAATENNKTNVERTLKCNDKEAAETPRECWAIGSDVRRSMTTKPHSAEPCRSSNINNNNDPVAGSTTGSISSTGGLTHTSANSTNDLCRTLHNKEVPVTSSIGGSSSVPSSRASSSGPGQRMRFMSIPEQFSSSAATAYQQRLLEEFRKKKAMHK